MVFTMKRNPTKFNRISFTNGNAWRQWIRLSDFQTKSIWCSRLERVSGVNCNVTITNEGEHFLKCIDPFHVNYVVKWFCEWKQCFIKVWRHNSMIARKTLASQQKNLNCWIIYFLSSLERIFWQMNVVRRLITDQNKFSVHYY